MSTIYADNIQPNLGSGVSIPGHVVQVVTYNEADTTSSALTTTSTSFVSTGKSISITPSSDTSKIVLMANFNANDTTANNGMVFKFYRGSTGLGPNSGQIWFNNNSTNFHGAQNLLYTDEPSSTSATTYTLYYRTLGGSQVRIAQDWQGINLVAMEIAQ